MHESAVILLSDHFDRQWFRFTFLTSTILGLCWCLLTPPFQVADENFHFFRAYQISQGDFISQQVRLDTVLSANLTAYLPDETFVYRLNKTSQPATPPNPSILLHGGKLPSEIPELSNYLIERIPHDPDAKLSLAKLRGVFRDRVSAGDPQAFVSFPNSAAYSPVAYLPQATGILFSRALHLGVIFDFYFARVFSVVIGALVVAAAVAIIPWGKACLSFFALIPMYIFQLASCSADAMVLSLSVLLVAICFRLSAKIEFDSRLVFLAGIVWGLLFLSKTVYAGLLLLLLPSLWTHRRRLCRFPEILAFPCLAICAIPGLLWAQEAVNMFIPPTGYIQANPKAQILFIKGNIFNFLKAAFLGLKHFFPILYREGIGVLGWLDTHLHASVYWICSGSFWGLVLAEHQENRQGLFSFTALITAIATYLLVVISIFSVWNPVGVFMLNGLQGRYLLPLVPCIAISLRYAIPWGGRVSPNVLRKMVLLLMLITQSLTIHTVIKRYWIW